MQTYTEESIKIFVHIFFLKVVKEKSIADIHKSLETLGKVYSNATILKYNTVINVILIDSLHPQHAIANKFLKELKDADAVQSATEVKKYIDESFSNVKTTPIDTISVSIQSFFDLNARIDEEKEKVRLQIDRFIMTQYMKLSHILGDFYELIISLSKEELETAILIGENNKRICDMDEALKSLDEETAKILAFKKELNCNFPEPHYWYRYASMLFDDFTFKRNELSHAVEVFKNPYDIDKKKRFLERITNPFFNFKRMSNITTF